MFLKDVKGCVADMLVEHQCTTCLTSLVPVANLAIAPHKHHAVLCLIHVSFRILQQAALRNLADLHILVS